MSLKILVVGCGQMGSSHARAYRALGQFDIVGLVSRRPESREALAKELGGGISLFEEFHTALRECKPDAVSINSYSESHAEYAIAALEAGAHCFVEKPLATSVADAEAVVETARRMDRRLVVGYILRHHPAWQRFIEEAHALGSPLVMRMSLNQQSDGAAWEIHKNLMRSTSPIVDCGVHYVDVMCQMAQSNPIRVAAIGARLTDEVAPDMYNYGQLQVVFGDGSVGWYEAGWGPMVSEEACSVKDVMGPRGAVTLISPIGRSADLESHTAFHRLKIRRDGRDEMVEVGGEIDHGTLCHREQRYFLRVIEEKLDLTEHHLSAIRSLQVVLDADRSVRSC